MEKVLSKIAGQCPKNFGRFPGSILPEILEIYQWLVAVTCAFSFRQFMDTRVHNYWINWVYQLTLKNLNESWHNPICYVLPHLKGVIFTCHLYSEKDFFAGSQCFYQNLLKLTFQWRFFFCRHCTDFAFFIDTMYFFAR